MKKLRGLKPGSLKDGFTRVRPHVALFFFIKEECEREFHLQDWR